MVWDPIWETIFQASDWGAYPPEALIRFMAANYYSRKDRTRVRVLDIGCGAGAGSWYLAREGFRVSAIDGSFTAIEKAATKLRRENLKAEFVVRSVESLPWPSGTFDCVIDIGCLTCNNEKDTASILEEIYRVLKSGGRLFSMTLKHDSRAEGKGEKIDATSYKGITDGPTAHMGTIRFATKASIRRLYGKFHIIHLEQMTRTIMNQRHTLAHWNIECQK